MSDYTSYDDKVLLDLLAKNDEPAFTEIYHRYWKKLFAIAYNRLREVQTAEDVIHDIFTNLWLKRNDVIIESLENYLAICVKYIVLSKIKKKENERIYTLSAVQASTTDATFEDAVHFKRLLEIVNEEVERLPERCRLIFHNSRNESKPVKQIAAELNISPKTVENQIHRAIRQLKLATRSSIFLLATLFI